MESPMQTYYTMHMWESWTNTSVHPLPPSFMYPEKWLGREGCVTLKLVKEKTILVQGNSRLGFGRCILSCFHIIYVHYLSILLQQLRRHIPNRFHEFPFNWKLFVFYCGSLDGTTTKTGGRIFFCGSPHLLIAKKIVNIVKTGDYCSIIHLR